MRFFQVVLDYLAGVAIPNPEISKAYTSRYEPTDSHIYAYTPAHILLSPLDLACIGVIGRGTPEGNTPPRATCEELAVQSRRLTLLEP